MFLHMDDNGGILGAELQGTNTYQRFKGVAAGTSESVFALKIGEPNKVYVFESAIDLLSFRATRFWLTVELRTLTSCSKRPLAPVS